MVLGQTAGGEGNMAARPDLAPSPPCTKHIQHSAQTLDGGNGHPVDWEPRDLAREGQQSSTPGASSSSATKASPSDADERRGKKGCHMRRFRCMRQRFPQARNSAGAETSMMASLPTAVPAPAGSE